MEQQSKIGSDSTLMAVVIACVLVVLAFYGLDHLIMGMQGLPLNMDLSPAG